MVNRETKDQPFIELEHELMKNADIFLASLSLCTQHPRPCKYVLVEQLHKVSRGVAALAERLEDVRTVPLTAAVFPILDAAEWTLLVWKAVANAVDDASVHATGHDDAQDFRELSSRAMTTHRGARAKLERLRDHYREQLEAFFLFLEVDPEEMYQGT